MYRAHFGLTQNPFDKSLPPEDFFIVTVRPRPPCDRPLWRPILAREPERGGWCRWQDNVEVGKSGSA